MSLHIAPLQAEDRLAWMPLARGYREFYKTPTREDEFERVWQRLLARDGVQGLAAHRDGELVGIAHYFFHTSLWAPAVCYLQDLFTLPAARGQGVGRALIEAVAEAARAQGATRYYWLTQEDNAVARRLYDQLARYGGFIRYDYAL